MNIKTLLAAVATLVFTPAISHADNTMPRELHGAWCLASDNGGKGLNNNGYNNKVEKYNRTTGHNRTDIGCRDKDSGEWMVISRTGYESIESGCYVAKSFVAGTEEVAPGLFRQVFQVNFKNCSGEGSVWNEIWRAYIDNDGRLTVRTKVTNMKDVG
jgi:hypothetical protein